MIHLVFVKIHPLNDGNGRSARLIEKWFLAQKLGKKPACCKARRTTTCSIKFIT
ncbi:MAG: Fic family protein [Bacteroidetes bacterium]|nr:Fic family protein [Bacteroidota bacterium]